MTSVATTLSAGALLPEQPALEMLAAPINKTTKASDIGTLLTLPTRLIDITFFLILAAPERWKLNH
jgi:hypothetical protein